MELLKDVFVFLWAVINNWAGYCTGGIIMALLWLWSTRKEQALPRKIGTIVALCFLGVAVFSAWRDQKKKVESSMEEVRNLRLQISALNQPAFSARIDFAILGAQPKGSQVALIVSLTNTGAPSAVLPESWELKAVAADGRSFEGWPNTLKDKNLDFCLSPKMLMRFVRSDALYLKASRPVDRNGYQQGLLWFGFPDLPRELLIQPATRLILAATSITGEDFKTEITVQRLQELSQSGTKFFAGIENPAPIHENCTENAPY